MPSFLNTLGAVSRRGQWRFRQVLRAADARGRIDTSDAGLIDFSACSEVALEVVPRSPACLGFDCAGPSPVLAASLTSGTLFVSNPGLVEVVFPSGSLLHLPPGLYDVLILITIGPETEEIFREPIEFG